MNLLDPQGPVGAAEKTILLNSLAIMLAIVVPTIVATLALRLVVPRLATPGRAICPTSSYSGRIELVVWSIPALVIMLPRRHRLDRLAPARSRPTPLAGAGASRSKCRSSRSTGNGCSSIPSRASPASTSWSCPAGAPVHFPLTSASVMNAFFVPQLGSMIYTMNGMATQLNLQADQPGDYHGPVGAFQRRRLLRTCTSTVRRRAAGGVRRLGRAARAGAGPTLDDAGLRGARRAEQQRHARRPIGAVEPGLFDAIVDADAAARRRARRPAADGAPSRRDRRADDARQARPGQAHPVRPADPADRRRAWWSWRSLGVLGWVVAQGLSALSLARVDHQRRSQAHRRDVLRCWRW